ncbi:MAG: N(G),N(G)-dimethylarginine dimethylaminohydrolase [Aquincola sp.]|nr:N(G),N(G)-dimethylarginine dimethylaminohydrolase [Aquincola sp.]
MIIPGRGAMLTRPGAASREDEVVRMAPALREHFPELAQITAPGTLDGGDVCEAGSHVFIGLSHRTNENGAAQLAHWLTRFGYTASTVDIRQIPGILHLKSGIAAIDPQRLVLIDALAGHEAFAGYDVIRVPLGEEYGANCVRVNDVVLVSVGQPKLDSALRARGYTLEVLDMSEYHKMDGGLSCLSLRF